MTLINDAFKLITLTNKLKAVERKIAVPSLGRLENTAEHSFQVAMLGWYLSIKLNLNLDLDKIIKYLLCHDLVEAYAGDVDLFANEVDISLKKETESLVIKQLALEFADFPEMNEAIYAYEMQLEPEAQFAFFIDKLAPFINDLISGMQNSITKGVTISKLRERIVVPQTYPGAAFIFEELIELAKVCYLQAGANHLLI